MFEITGDHISLLNDENLRALIGLLCEAEARREGVSPLGVTYGGDQNAADGGLDVRADLSAQPGPQSNLRRPLTGFQAKAQDMPRAAILAEMKPKRTVRPVIRELADSSGAYIIVSSKGSVSDSALRARRSAMAEAVRDLTNANSLLLDFYDRTRLASWVREHVGLELWLRAKTGTPVAGWKPYGAWATSSESPTAEYFLDDALRVRHRDQTAESSSALDGIQQIRTHLSREQGVVRLIGLSGVGKTRLAQALFDDRLGENALDPSFAAYTNLSDEPNPQPVAMASDLAAQRKRVILVVDNCGQELHRQLSEVCKSPESRISLLTIEFDIQDDLPEGTDVFDLQPSSVGLITRILERRFPELSQVNVQTVASFAGGNARVAIALAGTIKSGESVAELRDNVLFERLFHQRNQPSNSLLQAAQACSLVYSFNGEDDSGAEEGELWRLADVVGKDIRSVYAELAELRRRDLLQQRGVWRALLPHAVANRLAALALESIPPYAMERFWKTAPDRLLKSFSRRLGYLHTSAEARSIVDQWLSADGILGRADSLNELGRSMLCDVAPVSPHATLDVIQRAVEEAKSNGSQLTGEQFRTLLVSLAYDPDHFERAMALLFEVIESEKPGMSSVRRSFPSLFHALLSGTHATIEQRLRVIESLLASEREQRREFGLSSLKAALKTRFFSSSQRFDFGARPRDFGFVPRTREEIVHWYTSTLSLCKRFAANDEIAPQIREAVAESLRGLWDLGLHEEVEDICRELSPGEFWPKAWKAIHSIRRWRKEPLATDLERRMLAVEELLRPRSLPDRVRAVVLGNPHDAFMDEGPETDVTAQLDRLLSLAYELGREVALDEFALNELIPRLVTAEPAAMALGHFVKGLIDGSSDHRRIWDHVLERFIATEPTTRSAECLAIFLLNLRSLDSGLVEVLLDESMNEPSLKEWIPLLQCRAGMRAEGVQRMKNSLAEGIASIERYGNLVYRDDNLNGKDLAELCSLIAQRPGGFNVALEIVWMRIATHKQNKIPIPEEILAAGRSLLRRFEFKDTNDSQTFHLTQLIKICLAGPPGEAVAIEMCQHIRSSLQHWHFSDSETTSVLGALLPTQPVAVLDALFPLDAEHDNHIGRMRFEMDLHNRSAFDNVPEQTLLAWCEQRRTVRYSLMAALIFPFRVEQNSETRLWTQTALRLLDRAPDRVEVLRQYIDKFRPMSWSGSRISPWAANVKLLDSLVDYPDPRLIAFVADEKIRLSGVLDSVRQREASKESRENERFE